MLTMCHFNTMEELKRDIKNIKKALLLMIEIKEDFHGMMLNQIMPPVDYTLSKESCDEAVRKYAKIIKRKIKEFRELLSDE